MIRVVILLTILGLSVAAPPPFRQLQPQLKKDTYSVEGIVGDSQVRNQPEGIHVRSAPQDPVVIAGEYGGSDFQETTPEFDYDLHQAKSAHYEFDAAVQDGINDHSHVRTESRDGLKVKGMYSYSDGFFHNTVHYEADENGYRVVKQETKPIGDGPKFNPKGRADVRGSLIGAYSIKIDENKRLPSYIDVNENRH